MARYAVIDSGIVINVALAEPEHADAQGWIECPADVGPGWRHEGGQFLPPLSRPVVELHAEAWEKIKARRDMLSATGGYKVAVSGVDKWFHSDGKSQTQQLGLARKADKIEAAGGSMETPFPGPGPGGYLYWKTMDGSFVPMTPALAQAIFSAAEAQDMALFAVAEQHKAAMEASADPASYDFTTGWPAVFQGAST